MIDLHPNYISYGMNLMVAQAVLDSPNRTESDKELARGHLEEAAPYLSIRGSNIKDSDLFATIMAGMPLNGVLATSRSIERARKILEASELEFGEFPFINGVVFTFQNKKDHEAACNLLGKVR